MAARVTQTINELELANEERHARITQTVAELDLSAEARQARVTLTFVEIDMQARRSRVAQFVQHPCRSRLAPNARQL